MQALNEYYFYVIQYVNGGSNVIGGGLKIFQNGRASLWTASAQYGYEEMHFVLLLHNLTGPHRPHRPS